MTEVDALLEEIKQIQHSILAIQLCCPHTDTDKHHGSGYGPDWWVDYTCLKCRKKWREYTNDSV